MENKPSLKKIGDIIEYVKHFANLQDKWIKTEKLTHINIIKMEYLAMSKGIPNKLVMPFETSMNPPFGCITMRA
jgi:hypothetical protein